MFDGTAKLKAVDFNAASSKDAAVTGKTAALGKGGQVTDLKQFGSQRLNLLHVFFFSVKETIGKILKCKMQCVRIRKQRH